MRKCNEDIESFKKRERKKGYGFLSYHLKSITLRLCVSILFATLLIWLIAYFGGSEAPLRQAKLSDYMRVVVVFFLVTESHIFLDKLLEYFLPLPYKIRIRIAIQSVFGVLSIIIAFKGLMFFSTDYSEIPRPIMVIGVSLGLVFIAHLTGMLLTFRLTESWIHMENQVERLKQEKLQSDYNHLQDQLNPHFLFNNLSVLKSLILYDTNTAVKFTDDFTDVYRYVLDSKNKTIVSLQSELAFIQAYVGLHKERLGDGLHVKYHYTDDDLTKQISPLTLQLLVENAIKHNIVEQSKPLYVTIRVIDYSIIVENTIQKKQSSYSTHTGLNNMIERYRMITPKEIDIYEDGTIFRVTVPLI